MVIEIRDSMTGYDAVAVKWEDGSIARNYIKPRELTLLGRIVPAGRIPRPRLAEILKKRV